MTRGSVALLAHRVLRRVRAASFAALAVFMAALSANAPEIVELAVADETAPCTTPCETSSADGDCSPICHSGACARVAPAAVPQLASIEAVTPLAATLSDVPPLTTLAPPTGVTSAVFHPPRV